MANLELSQVYSAMNKISESGILGSIFTKILILNRISNHSPCPTFLTAAWRRLVLLNYRFDAAILQPYLPAHTELDLWSGTCYVSLVGFLFQDTKVKGLKIPFHVNFEEINLRFYVRRQEAPGTDWKRGVVFVREIVPKPAIAWVANTLYRERYLARRM